ncbi:glucuronate isomerase [Granulosicoccus sp.]|nr:glucuronate isomerase [Granulosicoccus sp.]
MSTVFGINQRVSAATADDNFDAIAKKLAEPDFTPRALYDSFGIKMIATTVSALDDLAEHQQATVILWFRI